MKNKNLMHWFQISLIFCVLTFLYNTPAHPTELLPLSDIETLSDAVGAESAPLLPLVGRLRFFALILLGMALTVAAIFLAAGRSSPAISVGMGALILSGGIWILSMFWQVFGKTEERIEGRSGEYAELQVEEGLSGTDQFLRKLGRECITILSKTLTPFILVEGIWLALALPSAGWSDPVCIRFLMGSVLAFSAVMGGRLFFFVF